MGKGIGHVGDLALTIVLVVLQLLFHIEIVQVSGEFQDFEFTHISLIQQVSFEPLKHAQVSSTCSEDAPKE